MKSNFGLTHKILICFRLELRTCSLSSYANEFWKSPAQRNRKPRSKTAPSNRKRGLYTSTSSTLKLCWHAEEKFQIGLRKIKSLCDNKHKAKSLVTNFACFGHPLLLLLSSLRRSTRPFSSEIRASPKKFCVPPSRDRSNPKLGIQESFKSNQENL